MIYNHDMDSKQFIEKEEDLKDAIRSSDIYVRLKKLSKEIDRNDDIRLLAEERDALYLKSSQVTDEERKREILKEAKAKDDQIQSYDIVKAYNDIYQRLRRLLNHLTENISEILR